MQTTSSQNGIRWGWIIGIIYCVMVFLRFSVGADNAAIFGLLTVVGYIIVLILLFFCGTSLRKKNGGFVEMKEAFKTMFIAVLIFELLFSIFSLVYLKYIDPGFFDKFRLSSEKLLDMAKQSPDETNKMLKTIDDWATQTKNLNAFDFLKTYLSNVAITGLFALIYSLIIKKKPPVFQQENFLNQG